MLMKLTKRTLDGLKPRPGPYDLRDSELRGFLVRVERSGAKIFFLDYRTNGKRNRYKLGVFPNLSVEGARELARIAAGDLAKGIDLQARKRAEREQAERDHAATLGAFLERYGEWEAVHRRDHHAKRLQRFPAEWLGKPLSDLNMWLLDGWRRNKLKKGRKPTTINRDIAALRSVLNKAVDWGVIDHSPLMRLKALRTDSIGRVRFLSKDEEKRLRAVLRERDQQMRERRARFNQWLAERRRPAEPPYPSPYADHVEPLVLLLLNTGLRFGEGVQLKHRDVNLRERLLTVAGEGAKSHHTRVVPLNAEAVEILSALRGEPDALVFPGDGGARLGSIKKAWRAVLKSAAIDGFRVHDLRHSFASRVKRGGADLYVLQRLLGHSSPLMTQRYAHLQPDDLRAAVERIAS